MNLVLTGSTSGIGWETLLALLPQFDRVFLPVRNIPKAEQLIQSLAEKEKIVELNKNHLKSLESILDENYDTISNDPAQSDDYQHEEKNENVQNNQREIKSINDSQECQIENYSLEEQSIKKGAVLYQSVQQRKNYEEKVSILKNRLKKLKEQEDELNKRLVVEKKKIIKS